MVIKTIDTNALEANGIVVGKRMFIFRNSNDRYQDGDVIQFRVIRNGNIIPHAISDKHYLVTAVMDHSNSPVEKGYQFIGFARWEDILR